ncbi:9966_t:CDS:1, partial [Scutellospora calospora]
MPATVAYLCYLGYEIARDPTTVPILSLTLLAAVYGLQAVIFILRRKWEHVGWMIVYILAMPVFSFYLPVYAFWHFDDFSWGNTRVVVGEKGKKSTVADEGKFDPKTIPRKKWSDYEQELWEVNTQGSQDSAHTRISDRSYHSNRSNKKLVSAPGSQAGSAYGDYYEERGGMKSRSRSRSPAPPYMDENIRSNHNLIGADMRSSQSRSTRPGDSASHRGSTLVRVDNELSGSRPASLIEAGYYGSSIIDSGFPSDDEILQEIRNILSAANLMTITKKQVRDDLSNYFGMDISSKK